MSKQCAQIAIDGPAGAGKTTVAKIVADKLDAYFVNTGDMYRAATLFLLRHCSDIYGTLQENPGKLVDQIAVHYEPTNNRELQLILNGERVNPEALRTPEVTQYVSAVSANKDIRQRLVARQRDLVQLGTVVLEGRDIGTNVCPETPNKFFLTASAEIRARRRLEQKGKAVTNEALQATAADIARRDKYDASREIAPLTAAEDACKINSDNKTAEEVAQEIIKRINVDDC